MKIVNNLGVVAMVRHYGLKPVCPKSKSRYIFKCGCGRRITFKISKGPPNQCSRRCPILQEKVWIAKLNRYLERLHATGRVVCWTVREDILLGLSFKDDPKRFIEQVKQLGREVVENELGLR